MQSEIEVKFLNVDIDDVRRKLEAVGAKLDKPMRLMRRAIIDYPDKRLQTVGGYIRVRDQGDKITLTYKQFDALSIDGAKEIETDVSSFDETVALFKVIGLTVHSLQESKRETWHLGEVEVVIDIWPWLAPYIEIEGPSEDALKEVAAKLGFYWSTAAYGDVMVAYRAEYSHLTVDQTVGSIAEVRFETPLPDMLKPGK